MQQKSVIKFHRSRNVKLPSRANKNDAGLDFYVPSFDKEFVEALMAKNPDLFEKKTNTNTNLYIAGSMTLTGAPSDIANKVCFELNDENSGLFKFDEKTGENYFLLPPLSRANIPSGIFCSMGENRALIAFNKSGVATKLGLTAGAQVVDKDYQGEIHISVINTSSKTVRIYENQKLIQFIEIPIYLSTVQEEKYMEDLHPEKTERGDTGFGHSDKK